jgi:hypothetical protein
MSNLNERATRYLQKKFPSATVLSESFEIKELITQKVTKIIYFLIAHDWESGIMQRLISVPDLGSTNELDALIKDGIDIFKKLFNSTYISRENFENVPKSHEFDTTTLTNTPKILLYTNYLFIKYDFVLNAFKKNKILIEILNESDMYNCLFISYGSPDEGIASTINAYLNGHGVNTWFFPKDSLPGEKLHRVMFEGVNNYDKVLLLCSKNSLDRPGVLNELERVLEREAKEGGSSILIPITLDNYVFTDWHPVNKDLAEQIRSRVITKFPNCGINSKEFIEAATKLFNALSLL